MSPTVARLDSPEHALTTAEALGRCLQPGDVLGLTGTLGAGKTWLSHGLVAGILAARGLDDPDALPRVCSPSYTIVNTYETPVARIHHMDLYRLDDVDGLESTGYWDLLADPEAILLIEWMDRIPLAAPDDGWLELALDLVEPAEPDTSARTLALHPHGPRGAATLERLSAALSATSPRPR